MPLRHRLLANPESVQDMIVASEARYWEGVELFVSGSSAGGIYLMGYVAEMILKTGTVLLDGARPTDLIGPRLPPTRVWAKKHLPGLVDENYHSVWFWTHVLRQKRRIANKPFPAPIDSALVQRMRRLHGIWLVSMRYQPDRSLPMEARSVYDDATWLRDHRGALGV
jgi:hypothetical protein